MPSACTSPEKSARRESKSTPPILAASKRTWWRVCGPRRSPGRNDQCLAGNTSDDGPTGGYFHMGEALPW